VELISRQSGPVTRDPPPGAGNLVVDLVGADIAYEGKDLKNGVVSKLKDLNLMLATNWNKSSTRT